MLIEKLVDLINKTPWQLDNPIWIKQRKKDWAELSKTLRDMESFLPKDVRYYKSYYLTGELPEIKDELKDLPEHANCTILLLLHPLQTEENITELYLTFCQLREDANNNKQANYSNYRYRDKDFFFHRVLAKQNFYFKGNSQGVVHGLEEVYCRLLYGTTEQQWQELTRGNKCSFGAFCSSGTLLLLNPDTYINDHYQYLGDFSFYMAPLQDYTFGRTPVEVNQFLQLIQYYELLDPFKGIDEERYQRAWKLVNLTREKLNTTELPELLQQMWDFAQTPEGKEATYSSFPKKYPILTVLTE
ncbi:hypothetical protein Q4601_07555 [Shewanella sp. 1_MG-2023]|uniref:hypothetical protein n=1 Tax=unclassified Shewanella TaxID=196818 RepID=UPI0026E1F508|nr:MULTISPECIES: hypothetical protein [unclassified Shewanella]MDO6612400.1 hypothetical protein [Shewanella sp. 7_MG-2023]MDO6772254.1 hypothetical protein [Shewanella sp. 2_MG-2023]MDO6794160.1 hypothetical protein [Shewanella sp. 1_MG-2023]